MKLSPAMWNSGEKASVTSSAWMSIQLMRAMSLHQRFSWLSMTPLGVPVVPEVYMMIDNSSGRTGSGVGKGCDAVTACS